MLTRAEKAAAFEHTIRTIFDQWGDTPLVLAFQQNGILEPSTIINMHHRDIPDLKYTDDQGVEQHVPIRYLSLICILKAYHLHRHQQGDPIGDDWTSITAKMFDVYWIGPDYAAASMMTASSAPAPSAMAMSAQPYVHDPVADFKKGIK